MAPTPKRKHSKARKGKRMASRITAIPNGVVCKHCGFYRGRKVIDVVNKVEKKQAKNKK